MIKIKVLLLILLFSANFYGQEKIETKSSKLDSLFNVVREITPEYSNEINTAKLKLREYELEKIKRLFYYAYAHAPIEFKKRKNTWYEKWQKTGRKRIKPNERMKMVETALVERYGKDYVGFLKTPYIMRVKILEVFSTVYKREYKQNNRKYRRGMTYQQNAKVKILDIIKGNAYYSKGEIITIAYLPHWFQWVEASPKFSVGEEYVVPLNHWNEHKRDFLQLRLRGLHTLYQIKDEQVYTPLVNSKFVKPWSDFKNMFIDKYIMEKNGEEK